MENDARGRDGSKTQQAPSSTKRKDGIETETHRTSSTTRSTRRQNQTKKKELMNDLKILKTNTEGLTCDDIQMVLDLKQRVRAKLRNQG